MAILGKAITIREDLKVDNVYELANALNSIVYDRGKGLLFNVLEAQNVSETQLEANKRMVEFILGDIANQVQNQTISWLLTE